MNTPSLPFALTGLIVSCQGNHYAIGGNPEIIERLANILNAYDPTPAAVKIEHEVAPEFAHEASPALHAGLGYQFVDETVAALLEAKNAPEYASHNRRGVEVHRTHKSFAYVTGTREEFEHAFYILRHNSIPRHGRRSRLRDAVKLCRGFARTDFNKIKRENFLGFNVGRNSFIPEADPAGQSSVDGDRDWQANVFEGGAGKAFSETTKAAKH